MLSDIQIQDIKHTIGLNYRKKPFRNRYCAGGKRIPHWDDLVTKGLVSHIQRSREMGGHYYHLIGKGFEFVFNDPSTFKYDKRIKSWQKLKSCAVD